MTKAIYLALGTSLLRARKNGAVTLAEAEQTLARFSERLDAKYPAISPSGGRTGSG